MTEKDRINIGAFIAHHNIIRPVEYPWFGVKLISALYLLISIRFSISQPDTAEPTIIPYLGLIVSALLLIAGMLIEKRIVKNYNKSPGWCLYLSQSILYVYCMIIGTLAILLVIGFIWPQKVIDVIAATFILVAVTIGTAYLLTRKVIKAGYYQKCENAISEPIIAFSSSSVSIVIYMIFFQFVKETFTGLGYAILAVIMVEIASVLALIYYLKLKYAKKYNLEEYLPEKPIPSSYTNQL